MHTEYVSVYHNLLTIKFIAHTYRQIQNSLMRMERTVFKMGKKFE